MTEYKNLEDALSLLFPNGTTTDVSTLLTISDEKFESISREVLDSYQENVKTLHYFDDIDLEKNPSRKIYYTAACKENVELTDIIKYLHVIKIQRQLNQLALKH